MTKKEAFEKFHTKWWEQCSDDEIVQFQLFERKLCMPWSRFMHALCNVLGRDVFAHELASSNLENIKSELEGKREPPALAEILELIPSDKSIIISDLDRN